MKKKKYTKDLPKRMYLFFTGYADAGVPSYSKFARSIGVTLSVLEGYRVNRKFDEAYRECSEIRRDCLIDNGLTKRCDPSMAKFILSAEYRMGEEKPAADDRQVTVTLEVLGEGDCAAEPEQYAGGAVGGVK